MIDDNEIKKQLQSPTPPDDFEKNIRKAWHKTDSSIEKKTPRFWQAYAFASLVALILSGMILYNSPVTPAIITTAIADIQKDEFVGVKLEEEYKTWLAQKNINLPPSEMTVEMSKFCTLSGQLSFHLKIAGKHQGKVHLFILKRKPSLSLESKSGQLPTMSWRIIEPRANLYVLVLITNDMKKESVTKLIRKMFYA